MRSTMTALFVCLVVACGTVPSWGANAAPVVSNVAAVPRGGTSQMVDITYDLADIDGDLCTIWVAVSDDNGANWGAPCQTFTGDWGSGVLPGVGKQIAWDAGSDIAGHSGSFRVRVCADDGKGQGARLLVPAGWYYYQKTQWTFVPTFMIDKYEVTNAFYCQFLNAGGNDDHWSSSMKIGRTGGPATYYYTVLPGGWEEHPVLFVAKSDAEAFASWRSQVEGATYRLPTEQEWEKAAAWDPVEKKYYNYGFHRDSIDNTWANYSMGVGMTTPVGYYDGTSPRNDAKSFYGCYDMSGNVWEWMRDLSGANGAVRGGSWNFSALCCACSYRDVTTPSNRDDHFGFRLVLVSQ
jgi:hypothetical protein